MLNKFTQITAAAVFTIVATQSAFAAPEAITDDNVLIHDDFVSGVVVGSGASAQEFGADTIAEDEILIGDKGHSGVKLNQPSADAIAFVPTAHRSIQAVTDPILLSEKFGPVKADTDANLASR